MSSIADPHAALQALLSGAASSLQHFPPTSRYHGVATATLTQADGTTVIYLRRRFIPPPEAYALLQEYVVVQGDRLDNLAGRVLGDPEGFWRICDANAVLAPEELEAEGRIIRITLPAGVPGKASD